MTIDWKQRALTAEREVRRLKKVEHAAWHALDDSAQYPEEKRAEIAWPDWVTLAKLLPFDHPESFREWWAKR
jgi:hypothetical protein